MSIYCKGKARIQHEETKVIYDIACDDLDWKAVEINEKSMGQETLHEGSLEHPYLGDLIWSLCEYPVGVEESRDSNFGAHSLIENFEYGISSVE